MVVLLLALAGGIGEVDVEAQPLAGRYELVEINGSPLPASTLGRDLVREGSLLLTPGGRFTYTQAYRLCFPARCEEREYTVEGEWTRLAGDTLTFTSQSQSAVTDRPAVITPDGLVTCPPGTLGQCHHAAGPTLRFTRVLDRPAEGGDLTVRG